MYGETIGRKPSGNGSDDVEQRRTGSPAPRRIARRTLDGRARAAAMPLSTAITLASWTTGSRSVVLDVVDAAARRPTAWR